MICSAESSEFGRFKESAKSWIGFCHALDVRFPQSHIPNSLAGSRGGAPEVVIDNVLHAKVPSSSWSDIGRHVVGPSRSHLDVFLAVPTCCMCGMASPLRDDAGCLVVTLSPREPDRQRNQGEAIPGLL